MKRPAKAIEVPVPVEDLGGIILPTIDVGGHFRHNGEQGSLKPTTACDAMLFQWGGQTYRVGFAELTQAILAVLEGRLERRDIEGFERIRPRRNLDDELKDLSAMRKDSGLRHR